MISFFRYRTLIAVILLCSNVAFSQAIRTQKVSMKYEQRPLIPLTYGKGKYIIILNSEYLAKAKAAREMTVEKRIDEDNTLGRFLGNEFLKATTNKDSVAKRIIYRYEKLKAEVRDSTRAYYAYPNELVQQHIEIKGMHKASNIDSTDYVLTITPNRASFRLYERELNGRYYYDIKGNLTLNYIVAEKNGDTIQRGVFASSDYGKSSTKKYRSKAELDSVWNEMPNNKEILKAIDFWHEDAFEKLGNDLTFKLSNSFGTYLKTRHLNIFRIKPRKHNYADFNNASLQLAKGLRMMATNREEATTAIQFAIQAFEKIILQHEQGKKRARINDKVAGAAYYNLAEAYLWLGDFEQSEDYANQVIFNDLGGQAIGAAKRLLRLANDIKTREDINKGI